jgi:MarR family transcriptional regulator, transcriptional regulator for hemolysin
MKPRNRPIGLEVANTAKAVGRAFQDRLAAAGGTVPMWLILSSLKGDAWRTQLDLARSVGIEGPTLTRHLDGLEEQGLVRRVRDAADRRAVRVELTAAGERRFDELRQVVVAFNRALTAGLSEAELDRTRATLARLQANVKRSGPSLD